MYSHKYESCELLNCHTIESERPPKLNYCATYSAANNAVDSITIYDNASVNQS